MKILFGLFLTTSILLAAPLPKFLVRCPNDKCPLGQQALQAKKISVTGSTTVTNGFISERVITFKCSKCGPFTTRDKVFVPTPETPVEIK